MGDGSHLVEDPVGLGLRKVALVHRDDQRDLRSPRVLDNLSEKKWLKRSTKMAQVGLHIFLV